MSDLKSATPSDNLNKVVEGCTCNISDHEDREHRRGCRFYDYGLWDIVLKHRVQLLTADRNAELAREADEKTVKTLTLLINNEKIAELENILGDGTLHHYKVVAYITNRISKLRGVK